jgi:transposase
MIRMDQYEYIRTAYRVYGKSIREIMRETGHDRKTIRKVLQGEYGGYSKRRRQPYPVLGPYVDQIDSWLEADKEAPRKQRHTAKRIYDRLISEKGFCGSETTVRQYVRQAKVRLGVNAPKAFIPLEPECGREAEVDWGNATVRIGQEEVQVKLFCMRSKYSGKHFVRLYPCERQVAFFDAHMKAFEFFGGVFETIVYDNLTSAVEKVLRGRERKEQESFSRFHAYYSYKPRFCNPGAGNEKGGVEGLVGYARRNYMVPIPEAESLEALNDGLLKECIRYGSHRIEGRSRRVSELFEEERNHLLALPPVGFSNIEAVESKVNAYSTVIVDRNRYSVPSRYVGVRVRIQLGVDRVEVFYNSKRIGSHARVFGDNKWQINPDHYLDLLQQRPGAFDTAIPIKQWRKSWPECLERLREKFIERLGQTGGVKEFLSVLLLYRHYGPEQIERAVEEAVKAGVSSKAGVEHLLMHSSSQSAPEPLSGWPGTVAQDPSVYAQLGGLP